ncbi:hypothetical protein V3N99_02715 [Dermatophilaceae bacterium Soc4.6]
MRFRPALAALPAAALALSLGLAAPAHSATPAAPDTTAGATAARGNAASARSGAAWLADQITANGGYLAPFGRPDPGNTAYAVSALTAAGVGGRARDLAITYLKTQVGNLTDGGGNDNAGALANLVLAARAAGEDPRAFGGTGASNNLVRRLLATARTGGSDAGLFGVSAPTYDGAFRQGLALAALKASGVSASKLSAPIAWLQGQQCANGLWASYRADVTSPCASGDADTNSSALAGQGLAAYGLLQKRRALLTSLDAVQGADGGFPYTAAAGQESDPNSTALSIQLILAAGSAPNAARWKVGDVTPYAALQSFQLSCGDAAPDRGAYYTTFGGRTGDVLATIQAVPAQAGATLPVRQRTLTPGAPSYRCPEATATAFATARAARAARAGTVGHCPGTTGVTVAVDFSAFGAGTQVRCAPGTPATGVAALQQAGFTPAGTDRYGLAFICRINSKPAPAQDPCVNTPAPTAYWSYYHAAAGQTAWSYSSQGASTYAPAQGSIEAWAFGNGAKPTLTPTKVRNR